MEGMDVKIQDIFKILKQRWKTVAGIAFSITLFVAILNFFVIKPVYEVNTKIFIGKEETRDAGYDDNDVQMYQRLLKTYSELVTTKDLIGNAIKKNNLNITTKEVINDLKIIPSQDTQILDIHYQNNDNVLAKDVLISVRDEFMKENKVLIPNAMVKVIEDVELPLQPQSPNKSKNIALACLIGIMMGIAIALLKEYMDDTLKTKEQIEKIIGISVIGMIPCEEKN